jgi:hypothetical protein
LIEIAVMAALSPVVSHNAKTPFCEPR